MQISPKTRESFLYSDFYKTKKITFRVQIENFEEKKVMHSCLLDILSHIHNQKWSDNCKEIRYKHTSSMIIQCSLISDTFQYKWIYFDMLD